LQVLQLWVLKLAVDLRKRLFFRALSYASRKLSGGDGGNQERSLRHLILLIVYREGAGLAQQ